MSIKEDMQKYEERLFGKTVGKIPDDVIKKFKEDATKNLRYSLERDRIIGRVGDLGRLVVGGGASRVRARIGILRRRVGPRRLGQIGRASCRERV